MAEVFTARIGGEGDAPLADGAVPMIEVPSQIVAALDRGKRPPVLVTVSGHTWRSTVAVYGGQFYLPVNRANRAAAELDLGDRVEVRLELDASPREIEPPPALAAALSVDSAARSAWERLSVTTRREHAEAIGSAKQEATRGRRLAKLLASLRGH